MRDRGPLTKTGVTGLTWQQAWPGDLRETGSKQ